MRRSSASATRAGSPSANASTVWLIPRSFHEIGAVSGIGDYDENGELQQLTPANCVFGRARIDGRTVVVVGDDFTVRGGSADASISAKPLMAEEMAHDFRLPIIRIIEGSGGGGSVKTIETKGAANLPGGIGGNRWYRYTTENMARVPVVGLGLGSVAGLGAARLAASHYSIMTKSSAMFVAGPPVVKRLGSGPLQAGARRRRHPDPRRRDRPRRRHRGGGVRLRAALPVLSAVLGLRAAADVALRATIPSATRKR